MSAAAIFHPKLAAASFGQSIGPLLMGREQFAAHGIHLVNYVFPHLDVELDWHAQQRSILLRVDGTDYPYRPVGGWWITPNGERMQPGNAMVPQGNGLHPSREDGRPWPWFCFRGWREYHDHTSHQDASWASLRQDTRYAVLQLITQLQRELNKPGVTRA